MKNELMPCPCCGNGNAALESWKSRKGYEASVKCCGCLLQMASITYDKEEEAVEAVTKAWNARTIGWIPCSERLPEDGKIVTVWFEYAYSNGVLCQEVGTSFTLNGKWSGFVDGSSGWQQLRIIAWMPLPDKRVRCKR